jgi:hypothetical protein
VVERRRSRVIAVMPSQSLCGLSGLLTAARRRAEHVGMRRILATVTVRPARVVQADVWFRSTMQS